MILSPSRVCVLARQTFIQVLRMKVFYFLVVFAAIMLGMLWVDFGSVGKAQDSEQSLRVMKGAAFFSMNVFAAVFAIAATALLIPKDVEDRTLYTILCKPVTRLDYLLGRYFGVLAMLAIGLLCMDVLLSAALWHTVEGMLAEQLPAMQALGFSQELIDERVTTLRQHGAGVGLQLGVLAVFLKAAVLAAVALCLSTFSTSTLFTLLATLVVMVVGLMVDEARGVMAEYAAHGRESRVLSVAHWVAYLFPDFKLMSLEDATIQGRMLELGLILRVCLVAALHVSIALVLSWFIFRKKEV
ncbi:ABC transporter permease subunit [Rubritalea marina]|uniref:ABC transporter permease subunit n=1 Tax=Rubritalea marina TaxID=361055 RepID=UPI0012E9C8E5|nr:ABC transporter permease subunit [Rubritalea marina]